VPEVPSFEALFEYLLQGGPLPARDADDLDPLG
jgi:hypothetical protein